MAYFILPRVWDYPGLSCNIVCEQSFRNKKNVWQILLKVTMFSFKINVKTFLNLQSGPKSGAVYMGALIIFGSPESLSTPTATFPEICNGILFRSVLRMCVQNLKFVDLPVPKIIGYSSPWIRPRSFSKKKF